jgi:hypothetical protein
MTFGILCNKNIEPYHNFYCNLNSRKSHVPNVLIFLQTSREMLTSFSRDFLSGEGDIVKHLAYLGYKVVHQQVPLDEFDYAVTNIAMDLRCGVRLW